MPDTTITKHQSLLFNNDHKNGTAMAIPNNSSVSNSGFIDRELKKLTSQEKAIVADDGEDGGPAANDSEEEERD